MEKVNNGKPYLMQEINGYSIEYAFANFWIELIGETKFDPRVENYWPEIWPDFKTEEEQQAWLFELMKKKFKVDLVDLKPNWRSLRNLKRKMIRALNNGDMILFSFAHPEGFYHWALITHYYPRLDSFRIINAQLLNNESPVEYVKFEELTKVARGPCLLGELGYYNKIEKTNWIAETTITETKIIVPLHTKYRKKKKPRQSEHFMADH